MIEIIKNLLGGMLRHPALSREAMRLRKDVYVKVGDLDVSVLKSEEPIPYDEIHSKSFAPIKEGEFWAEEKFGCAWFKLTGKVPAKVTHPCIVFNVNGEGLAYSEGEPFDIVTTIMGVADVFQAPGAGKRIFDLTGKTDSEGNFTIFVDCGHNGVNGNFVFKPKFVYGYLAEKNDEVCDYYYDYLTVALLLVAEEKESLSPECKVLLKSSLAKSFKLYKDKNIPGAKSALAPLFEENSPEHRLINKYINKKNPVEYTAVGHAHLDLAWLWPKRETMRKALRTFTNALSLIDKNPDFVFGASQAWLYDWIKQNNPATFEKIQKAVADGNIEIQGGMWTECDCNIPSGESIIRQFMYGDKFFLENFGKTSKTVWLPDVFGYPATLPQIIKGVGKDNFATIKLTWNKTNTFPYQTFKWIAPDGSSVTSHISPEGTYCNEASPLTIAKSNRKNRQKEVGHALVIYGNGDGGGGAGEGHVEVLKRERNLYEKGKVDFGSAESFFEKLPSNIPEYKGELYLEKHRGTYTSQSENKRLNRALEHSLHTLEWLEVVGELKGDFTKSKDGNLSAPKTEELWKTLLFNQFHDILPGSGIERVHRESREELGDALSATNDKINSLIGDFGDTNSLCCVNPSPFAQVVEHVKDGATYRATAPGYSAVPFEKTSLAIPKFTNNTLENDLVRIVFASDGSIASYFDKTRLTETAKGRLHKLTAYKDKKMYYNAWDISNDYLKHPEKVKLVDTRCYTDGVYAIIEHLYNYGDSTITEKVKLGRTTQVIFDLTVDWKETHKMLRAEFEPAHFADTVDCDIQFGSIDRVTTERDSVEKEQFEICAHKYIATGNKNLFALYSNSKYGYRAKNGKMSINLLRSPKYPDPTCDMMLHHITYAMDIPATRKELVVRAYNFNSVPIITNKAVEIAPIATVDNNNVIIETIKPLKAGKGFAIRLYERYGSQVEANLKINANYTSLLETNLLEENGVPCNTTLSFRPHEIKTIVVKID